MQPFRPSTHNASNAATRWTRLGTMLARRPIARLLIAGVLLTGMLVAGCDWTVGPEPGQGEPSVPVAVTDVRVTPEPPLAAGDQAVFTAVTPDTATARIRYRWFLDGVARTLVTDTASVAWTAPDEAGTYRHVVVTELVADTSQTASREFRVRVEAAPRPPASAVARSSR